MRIKITKPGIYGADTEIPVGTLLTVKSEPVGWAGRYEVISADGEEEDGERVALTNPAAPALEAKHRGRGSYSVMNGDEEVLDGLTKEDAEAFNGLSDEDKAAFVASETAKKG